MRSVLRMLPAVAVMLGAGIPCVTASAQPGAVKNVLAVYWSSEDSPSNRDITEAVRAVLRGAGTPADYYSETWRVLQRIDPSGLPPASDIRFRTPTPWETYRWYIVGTGIVVVGQLMLIAGLLTQRARRRRAEAAVRERETTLLASYERIRDLAGRLINAQEATRAQIARDLHDDVCQELVGVSMAVSSLKRSSGRIQDARAQHALAGLQHRARTVVEGVRHLSHDLHPSTLRLVGLAPALKAHCIEVENRHDVQVSFKAEGGFEHLDGDVALCLFRIAQEALRNGAVHGAAHRLSVEIVRSAEQIELTVRDDGRGFDLDTVRRSGSGLGLVSIEERAHMVGGDVRLVTGPGRGTSIRVQVPAGVSATPNDLHADASALASHPPWPGGPSAGLHGE